MEQNKIYEWFITDVFTTKRQTGVFFTIKASCVTEDYKVIETFRINPDTVSCPALDHWIRLLIPNGLSAGQTYAEVFPKGLHFFAKVQPKYNTEAVKQELFYELDVLSLSPTLQKEVTEKDIESEVKRIVALGLDRKDTLSRLVQLGPEYVRIFRKGESA